MQRKFGKRRLFFPQLFQSSQNSGKIKKTQKLEFRQSDLSEEQTFLASLSQLKSAQVSSSQLKSAQVSLSQLMSAYVSLKVSLSQLKSA